MSTSNRIYMVQAQGFGETGFEWENIAAFSDEEVAESYLVKMQEKSHPDYKDCLRVVSEAFNPVFPYTQ